MTILVILSSDPLLCIDRDSSYCRSIKKKLNHLKYPGLDLSEAK